MTPDLWKYPFEKRSVSSHSSYAANQAGGEMMI